MQSEWKDSNINEQMAEVPQRVSEFRHIRKVLTSRWIVVFGIVIALIIIVMAIFAPLIAPYEPLKQNLAIALQQPSLDHLLGTDQLGRDLLSRIIYGSRVSLIVGVVATLLAFVIGMTLGLIAGYFGGLIDNVIMRIMDTIMALPPLVFAIALAAVMGGGMRNAMLYISIAFVPAYCRLMYGQVLSIKENEYITAARVIQARNLRIICFHVLPNSIAPLMIQMTLQIGMAILVESSLSFLGVGIAPPTPAWGGMVTDGYKYLLTNPALSLAPGVAVVLTVLAFNLIGDGLRDILDPKLRGAL